jgi:hypothetical protein
MIRLLILAIIIGAAITGNAQEKKWLVGAGGGLTMPFNFTKEYSKYGSNAFANATYNITPAFSAGGEINYTSLSNKTDIGHKSVNTDFFAVLAKGVYTARYEHISPYAAFNMGWYKMQESPTEFGYSGEVGILYRFLDFGVGYHIATVSGFEYLQVKVGYKFSF